MKKHLHNMRNPPVTPTSEGAPCYKLCDVAAAVNVSAADADRRPRFTHSSPGTVTK